VNENRRDRGDLWLSVAAYRAIDALDRVRRNGRANDNRAARAA
jgi:hypothetical protein